MGADLRARAAAWRGAGALLLALALPAGTADAAALGGTLTGQWQQVREHATLLRPDGSLRDTTIVRSFWSQSYELRHSFALGRDFSISSQLQYLDQSYTAREHATRTGGGTIRVAHPVFGLTATYRPTVRSTAPASLGLPSATPTYRRLKSRQDETLIAGNFAPPGLPRLDLSWTRQHRETDASPLEEATVARNARLSYSAGPLDLHAGYGDQSLDPGGVRPAEIQRRNGAAGAGLRLAPIPALAIGMQYDFSLHRAGAPAAPGLRTLVHAGSLTGSLRVSERAGWDLSYGYRRTRLRDHVETRLSNHDGSLLFHYAPNRVASFNLAGGVHTLNASTAPRTERFFSAVATANGRVRTAWAGSATASHATNWDRDARPVSIETFRVGSVFRASRDFQLGADLSASFNSSASQGVGPVATEVALTVAASPLKSVQLTAGSRDSRAGPGLFRPGTATGIRSLNLRWLPMRRIDFSGAIDHSRSGSGGRSGTTTRRATLDLQPGARLRLSATYSRSDQAIQQSGTSQLTGQEVYGAQLSLRLGRSATLRADTYQVDPRGRNFSRQFDAGLTKTFGR